MSELSPTCSVTIDKTEVEIFMSFALLNAVARHVGDPENIPLIMLNPDLREIILSELLAVRDPKGKVTQARSIDEVDITLLDVENLLDFVSEHVLDFMIRALEKTNARKDKYETRLKALVPSSTGPKT